MPSEKLNAAIQLIQSGRKQVAVPVLRELIQENPTDDQPWLWLHICMDDVEQKKFCLQRALALNPENTQARLALEVLMAPAESAPLVPLEAETRPWEDESAFKKFEWVEDNQPEKFDWEQTESVQQGEVDLQKRERDQPEPVYPKQLKHPTVKATPQPVQRRKPRSKRRSLFPVLAGLVLLTMLMTVCLVFFAQLYHP